MAIRRPSVYRQNGIVFQDFLYYSAGNGEELRYVLAKWDGEDFTEVGQTFDYPASQMKAGHVIARLDYTLLGQSVTIDHWEINWRDEWPLRLTTQFLAHCLYPSSLGYIVKVDKDAYTFWVSEDFVPLTNYPSDFLVHNDGNP